MEESRRMEVLAELDIGDRKKIRYNWYQWLLCSSCGKGRWVMLIRGQPRNKLCVHYPKERIDLFRQYGYQTLVIWERELRNTDALSIKIQGFVNV